MISHKEFFRGKRVTVMGLGLLGRGINAAKFLAECGADLIVTDLKTKDELKNSIKKLAGYKNIRFVLGKHRMRDFKNRDFILKAAGVPLDSPYIIEARKNKIPIEMDASLFARLSSAIIVGITGTKGKSTVTHLIYEIIKRSKKPVFLGGNVRGIATLPLLKKVKPGDIVVMELDSWQLQGFGDSKISPNIAIFTNFLQDHMNYYKGNMKEYFEDKAKIFKYQTKKDFIIVGEKLSKKTKSKGKKIIFRKSDIPKEWKIKLAGEHNKENIAAAIAVARTLGIKENIIKKTIENFNGVPGRMEFIRSVDGVEFYNDTAATAPIGVIVGLRAFDQDKSIILIAGGSDKKLDYKEMVREINKKVKALILFSGTATKKIIEFIDKKKAYPVYEVNNMKNAVNIAHAVSRKRDIVVLSPGAASFGLFNNEFDRGDQFIKYVKKLNG